jgi:arylsulfatase A-like enzyme
MDPNDAVHSIDVRIRASDGANLSANGFPAAGFNITQALQGFGRMWPMSSPVRAGEIFQDLSLQPSIAMRLQAAGVVAIRPVDVAGATFEIESVRLVSQKEHRESIPTGVGWNGLGDIYRETIVSRSPEKLRMDLEIPPDAWLDVNLGTVEAEPVTFKITASSAGREEVLLERTVTTPHRWEPAPIDLSRHSGKTALVFSLDIASERRVGFWGSPVIRRRNTPPRTQGASALGGVEPPQGVILIMCDTLRKDHLNMYGYGRETAPHLAKMASQGALFLDNVSQATWTKVATPSIMTSLHPSSHRVLDFSSHLSPAAHTIAEVYRENGYATVAYSSVLFTGKFSNLHQGYEELHETSMAPSDRYPAKTARVFVDRAADWIERHRDAPFFMFLHVFDPHDPFEPRPPYDTQWADAHKKEEHEKQTETVAKVIEDPLLKQFKMPNRAELEKVGLNADDYVSYDKDWYDGSIRGMDAEVARLMERLRALGLEQKIQIAFIADHGEEFIEHGRMFHGHTVYSELTNVPLMLYRPGAIPAVKIAETVRSIDLMPTLLALSGLPAPEGIQGQSLVPLIAGESSRWEKRPAVSEKVKTTEPFGPGPRDTESYAIVLDGWKLIHNRIPAVGAPEFELYSRADDPLDAKNVAGEHPDVVEKLKGELEGWHKMVADGRLPEGISEESLSPGELQRLRSLGYIK